MDAGLEAKVRKEIEDAKMKAVKTNFVSIRVSTVYH